MCCSTFVWAGRLLIREYGRIADHGIIDQHQYFAYDAALLEELAKAGVCTMQAAAAQQEGDLTLRTEAELRAPGFGAKWHVALSPACQMYGVPPPVERGDGSRFHHALFDAEMAGRLYFAMRGIRYRVPVRRVLRRLHSLSTSSASPLRVPATTGD